VDAGDLTRSAQLAQRAVAAAGDDPAARYGWHVWGDVGLFSGRLDRALNGFERADQFAGCADDRYHCALLRGCRALVHAYGGDEAEAASLAADSRQLTRDIGNPTAVAWSDYVTGEFLMAADPDQALVHLERAAATAEPVANEFVQGVAGLSAISIRAQPRRPGYRCPRVRRDHRSLGARRQSAPTVDHAAPTVELLVRLGRHGAAAVVLGAIQHGDAVNVYGADADRLARLRTEVRRHLGRSLDQSLAHGQALDRADVGAFARRDLVDAVRSGTRQQSSK
jgi:hypothetical protein